MKNRRKSIKFYGSTYSDALWEYGKWTRHLMDR